MGAFFYAIPKRDGTPRKNGRYIGTTHPDGTQSALYMTKTGGVKTADLSDPARLEARGYKRYPLG